MATNGFLAKEKLTAICDSIRAKTGSTGLIPIDDIPQAIANIQTGGGIIEVDELPSTNIDSNAFYKTPRKFIDVYIQTDNFTGFLFSESLNIVGAEVVETKPSSSIVESNASTSDIYIYYVTSENDIFIYVDMGAGVSWYNIGTCLQLYGMSGLTFVGETDELESLLKVTIGYYAYFENEKYYKENKNELIEYTNENTVLSRFFSKQPIEKAEIIINDSSIQQYAFEGKNINNLKIIGVDYTNGNQFIINSHVFLSCSAKTIYITHKVSSIVLEISGGQTFGGCVNLTSLILDFESISSFNSSSDFGNTPIGKGTGYIYVRDEIVETVKALDGWSTYASQIKPLSEYVEE